MEKKQSIFLISLFILFDQLSKYMIRSYGGFYICNKGIAFGLQIPFWLYLVFTTVILLVILLNFENWKLEIRNFALAIILAGALSNIFDRLYFGCVIDFIDLHFWPVFNLADSFIVIGVIMLIIKYTKK
jgi:signal peptidase II